MARQKRFHFAWGRSENHFYRWSVNGCQASSAIRGVYWFTSNAVPAWGCLIVWRYDSTLRGRQIAQFRNAGEVRLGQEEWENFADLVRVPMQVLIVKYYNSCNSFPVKDLFQLGSFPTKPGLDLPRLKSDSIKTLRWRETNYSWDLRDCFASRSWSKTRPGEVPPVCPFPAREVSRLMES